MAVYSTGEVALNEYGTVCSTGAVAWILAGAGCRSVAWYVMPAHSALLAHAASATLMVVFRGQPARSSPRARDPGWAQKPSAQGAPDSHHCHVWQLSPRVQHAAVHASGEVASPCGASVGQWVLPRSRVKDFALHAGLARTDELRANESTVRAAMIERLRERERERARGDQYTSTVTLLQ